MKASWLPFLIGASIVQTSTATSASQSNFQYVILESGPPTSVDPLDADATQNLAFARMIYLTPLEVSNEDRLTSTVLDSFSYEKADRTIHWRVRQGLKYTDGSDLTPDDVVLAVKRMALRRPSFPVIKEILGIGPWLRLAAPLAGSPSGLEVHGRDISIKLSKDVDHPLFRFCLELFSIIPSRCIDINSGALSCSEPPTSGYYRVAKKDSSGIHFEKRAEFPQIQGRPAPQSILFSYKQSDLLRNDAKLVNDQMVVAASDAAFSEVEMHKIENIFEVRALPRSRFSLFLLNPKSNQFKTMDCRQVFAQEFRTSYRKLHATGASAEGSILPNVLPGYKSLSELEKNRGDLSFEIRRECMAIWAIHPIKWAVVRDSRFPFFETVVSDALNALGQTNVEPIVCNSRVEQDELYVNGGVHLIRAATGLWPLDPYGDLQMLFTPNLHKTVEPLQNDQQLQAMIENLRTDIDPKLKIDAATKLTQHVFDGSIFNVYEYTRRFYLTKKGRSLNRIPLSITSPAPWQVFDGG